MEVETDEIDGEFDVRAAPSAAAAPPVRLAYRGNLHYDLLLDPSAPQDNTAGEDPARYDTAGKGPTRYDTAGEDPARYDTVGEDPARYAFGHAGAEGAAWWMERPGARRGNDFVRLPGVRYI